MRTKDLLAATATGLWRWDRAAGRVDLDAEAARLLGLPAKAVELSEAAARSRFHPVDYAEVNGTVNAGMVEQDVVDVRMRIVDGRGNVLRVVRSRSVKVRRPGGFDLEGVLQEVLEYQPGPEPVRPRAIGDWRRSREAFLLDAGRALAEARSTQEVLRVAANLSMPGFTPAGLVVFGLEADRLKVIGWHGYTWEDKRVFMNMPTDASHPAAEVIRAGRALYLATPEEFQRRYPTLWPKISHFATRSWAFLPLVYGGGTIGAAMAAFNHPVAFTPDERSVLTTVARMLAQALSRAGEQESQYELSLGLQRAMMPTARPDIAGMRLAARYVPTGGGMEIGGDWYDVISLPSGRRALVIGDVQGHDVRAAGVMGQLRIALRAYASEGHRPDAVLTRASRFLSDLNDSEFGTADPRFATCLYVEIDPSTGLLDIARAGHPDPVVRMADGTLLTRPTSGGPPLGVVPDADYPVTRLLMEPAETVLLFTDGLIETGGHDLDTGWDRIRSVIERFDAEGGEGSEVGPGGPGTPRDAGAPVSARTPGGPAARAARHRPALLDLDRLADTLVESVHGPASHHATGPLADRREDDIAVLLLGRDGEAEDGQEAAGAKTGPARPSRRSVLTVAQAEPDRIATARRQLREILHDWGRPDQVDSAELMVSEIITNVLMHTDVDALLIAEISGPPGRRRLRVDVADRSDELPHRRTPGEFASSGRGLVLLEALAGSWGVDPRGEGKSTWFELYEDAAETYSTAPGPAVPEDL